MVDGTGLENRHTRKGIGGSNPSLSATLYAEEIIGERAMIVQWPVST